MKLLKSFVMYTIEAIIECSFLLVKAVLMQMFLQMIQYEIFIWILSAGVGLEENISLG